MVVLQIKEIIESQSNQENALNDDQLILFLFFSRNSLSIYNSLGDI